MNAPLSRTAPLALSETESRLWHSYAANSRLLAFLAVSCAIAAVGWAIRDISVPAIGIPGLAAGHLYSWRHREASLIRSLILLLFMALTVFLGGDILLSGLGDRLLLSRYLVYGLVLGSFDLMRRRNVAASVILGALLLVLVSELALSAWFAVFVVAFTSLSVGAAATGRIENEAEHATVIGEVKWLSSARVWIGFSVAAVLVAAALFLFMPRLSSRQVTQANWLPSRLDMTLGGRLQLPSRPGASVESGIIISLQDSESSGQEGGNSGRSRYATLGYTGSSADTAVMNVRSPISSYWRGMTLDEYDGRGWLSSSGQVKLFNEGQGEFRLPDSRAALPGERAYWQLYYVLSDQPNAIFTGYNPGKLYFSRLDPGGLTEGTLYRALSAVPSIRPELLRRDSVANDEANLRLPPITDRTLALAESIVAGATSDYDKAARLERFLLTNYPYRLDVGPLPQGRDAVDNFLFEQQSGYCAHFATAMAVMARAVGLPARVAAGYLPGYIDPLTGAHVVRVGDAHAWVEIHFEKNGWVAFDPTPRPDAAMGFIGKRSWLRFGLEDFTGASAAGRLSSVGRLSLGGLPANIWLFVVLAPGAIIVLALAYRLRRRTKAGLEPVKYSHLDGQSRRTALQLYRRMLRLLARKGLPPRLPHQPPEEYAALVSAQAPAVRETVERLTRLASRAAYDPGTFSSPDVQQLKQSLFTLAQKLKLKSQNHS